MKPDQIRAIRKGRGETQEQFAAVIGVAKVTVARWETGTRKCEPPYALKIALEGHGCDLQEYDCERDAAGLFTVACSTCGELIYEMDL